MDSGSPALQPYLILTALLLLGGAYFAIAETAFASVNRIRMISDADDGDKRASRVLYVLDNFDKALTTILIGNNIMHIACSSAATFFAAKKWGSDAVTITTFVTTFVVFFFAEMLPKSYAKDCSETLAPALAGSLIFLMKLLAPISFLFSGISNMISRLVKADADNEPTVTEEELFDIIENIDNEDKIDDDEAELMQSALEFTVTKAKDILIPFEKVVTLKNSMSDDEVFDIILSNSFSRYPVKDDSGEYIGVLQIRKFLRSKVRGRKVLKSRASLDPVYYIDAETPIDELLYEMSANKVHMGIVKDEQGNAAGIITAEDILEELVGEISDEEERSAKK